MDLDVQLFLDMAEETERIAFVDIEASGLRADYNSILVASVRPYGKVAKTFKVNSPGNDRTLVKELRDLMEEYPLWVTYYGKGFDIPMIRSRLLRYNMDDLKLSHHIDLYYALKYHTLTARHSQAHLIEWLNTPAKKMTLSPEVWNAVLTNPKKNLKTLVKRCEQDVAGLEGLYRRTRHLIKDLKR